MKTRLGMLGLSLLAATATGCSEPAPSARTFTYMRLTNVSRDQAFVAATQAMSERFRLERVDRAAGIITSTPTESEEVGTRGRVGDVVGAKRRVRTSAITRVHGSANNAEIWCKVVIEQNETNEQRLFASDVGMNDMPTETAADRGGATTPEQNTVWRTIRRDKTVERAVLRSVDEITRRNNAPPAQAIPKANVNQP